jgi:ketosteroid isomerase-like protein
MSATFAENKNVQRLRDGYDAFAKGDFSTMDNLIDEDVRWHVPGRNQLSGTKVGRPAVYDFFRRTMEITGGTFSVHLTNVFADDTDGMAAVTVTGHRGERVLDAMQIHRCRLHDGRLVELWEADSDQYAMDDLIG